jgi:hypothetical protein
VIQMTETRPEIETVTVSVQEFLDRVDHYLEITETTRLEVVHEGERVATLGPHLPGEERRLAPKFFWFLDQVDPRGPMDPESRTTQLLLDERETCRSSWIPRRW